MQAFNPTEATHWRLLSFATLWTALALGGCFHSEYLAQAVAGQARILDTRRPLARAVVDPKLSERERALIAAVPELKRFAAERGLRGTDNYDSFVRMPGRAAVWVVSASAPLQFVPETFWFPVTGAVPYLGWFDEAAARRFARRLQARGLDVNVREAATFSTLGFFRDPILSTMLDTDSPRFDDALADLANTIFHESLHATFYIAGRTDLNESVASFVGDRMTEELLLSRFGDEARGRYVQRFERYARAIALKRQAREELVALYGSTQDDATKLAQKAQVLNRLRAALGTKRVVNNATLIELGNYELGRRELSRLREACADWPAFLAAVARWGNAAAPSFASLPAGCSPDDAQGSK